MSWIVQHAVFTINRYLIRQDGKTSYKQVFNKAHSGPLVQFGVRGKSSGSCSSHPSLPKASFEGSASEALLIVVGKMRHHWDAYRGSRRSDSQTRTVTRLIKEQKFNPVEFSKIILPPHLTIKNLKKIALLFKSCLGHSSCKNQRCRTRTSSLWIKDLRSLLSMLAHHSQLHQPRERIRDHHCQHHHQHQPHFFSPQVFRCLRDFKFSILLKLSNQAQVSLSSKPSNQISNQFRSGEESGQSQNLKTHQKLQQYFRTSEKIIFLLLRIRSMQIVKKLNQRKSCFKVSFFRTSGILSRSDQGSYHKRAQANWSSRS